MHLRQQLEHFRREHDAILRFLREFEAALDLADGQVDGGCVEAVAQLERIENRLLAIRKHCREEERSVESPFQFYLEDVTTERLRADHELFDELLRAFCDELRRGQVQSRQAELVRRGRLLLAHARHHIAFEEGLLKQIEDAADAEPRGPASAS